MFKKIYINGLRGIKEPDILYPDLRIAGNPAGRRFGRTSFGASFHERKENFIWTSH